MVNKKYDIVGLGACGIDLRVKVKRLPTSNQKITVEAYEVSEGGVTANNLVQSARLGLKTAWVGALGDDEWKNFLLKSFQHEAVDSFSAKISKIPTQQFWIMTDPRGEWNMVGVLGASRKLTAKMVRNQFADQISQAEHFHTEVAVIPLSAALEGAKKAKKAKAKVLVDIDSDPHYLIEKEKIGTRKELTELIKIADTIKLSDTAAKGLAKQGVITKKALKRLLLMGPKMVVVTLGQKGCWIGTEKENVFCEGFHIKAIDTVGAGDAFMGGLSYGILRDWPIVKLGQFANACGAFKTTRFGTRSSGSIKEVNDFIKRYVKN